MKNFILKKKINNKLMNLCLKKHNFLIFKKKQLNVFNQKALFKKQIKFVPLSKSLDFPYLKFPLNIVHFLKFSSFYSYYLKNKKFFLIRINFYILKNTFNIIKNLDFLTQFYSIKQSLFIFKNLIFFLVQQPLSIKQVS